MVPSFNMANFTTSDLPPLPPYTLHPRPPLIPSIPDKHLSLLLPIIAYWVLSMLFHYIDVYDCFPQYRLHTPTEVLKRNHVSRWEVVRDVIIQQIVQTIVGGVLAFYEEDELGGKDDYNVAIWAQRIRLVQLALPKLLGTIGIDASGLAQKLLPINPSLAGALAGGSYPWLSEMRGGIYVSTFANWELGAAKTLYWIIIPAFQFVLAITILDTWQYFLHRAMHMNKWLYTTFHSRHHRLYVPYAYGALYNHPFEGFLLDTLGTVVAYLVSGLSPRQAMCFFAGSTIKTVDDHCGYAFPWDPLQHITSNNAAYHDVHHQSWGIKTNFSQPFFTFWDRILGTVWVGGDVSARYERARVAAERKIAQDRQKSNQSQTNTVQRPLAVTDGPYVDEINQAKVLDLSLQKSIEPIVPDGKAAIQALGSREQVLQDRSVAGGPTILLAEMAEENNVKRSMRKHRVRTSNASNTTSGQSVGSLKGLRDRVGSFHGRTGGVLGYESSR